MLEICTGSYQLFRLLSLQAVETRLEVGLRHLCLLRTLSVEGGR